MCYEENLPFLNPEKMSPDSPSYMWNWGNRFLLQRFPSTSQDKETRPGIVACNSTQAKDLSCITYLLQCSHNHRGRYPLLRGQGGCNRDGFIDPSLAVWRPRTAFSHTGKISDKIIDSLFYSMCEILGVFHFTGGKEYLSKLPLRRLESLVRCGFPVFPQWDVVWLDGNSPTYSPGPYLVVSCSIFNEVVCVPLFWAVPLIRENALLNSVRPKSDPILPDGSRLSDYTPFVAGMRSIDLRFYFAKCNRCFNPKGPLEERAFWLLPDGKCLQCDDFVSPKELPWPKRICEFPHDKRPQLLSDLVNYLSK